MSQTRRGSSPNTNTSNVQEGFEQTKRMRATETEQEILQNIAEQLKTANSERSFALLLVAHLKKITENLKLEACSEILLVLKKCVRPSIPPMATGFSFPSTPH